MKSLAPIEKLLDHKMKALGFQKKRELYARIYPAHSILFALLVKPTLVGDLTVFSIDTGFNLTNRIPFRRYIDFKANPYLLGGPYHYRMGTMKHPGATKVDYWYRMGSEKDLARNHLADGAEEPQMFTGTEETVKARLAADMEALLVPWATLADEKKLMEGLAFTFHNDNAALNLIFTLCAAGQRDEAQQTWERYADRKTAEKKHLEDDNAPLQILDQFDRSFAEETEEVRQALTS